MRLDDYERLYVIATRLQALRDITKLADIGLDPTPKKIAALAVEGTDRLEAELDRLREKLVPPAVWRRLDTHARYSHHALRPAPLATADRDDAAGGGTGEEAADGVRTGVRRPVAEGTGVVPARPSAVRAVRGGGADDGGNGGGPPDAAPRGRGAVLDSLELGRPVRRLS